MHRLMLPVCAAVLAAPSLAQDFEYVHGGDAVRATVLSDDAAWITLSGGVIRYTNDGGLTFNNAQVPSDVRSTLRNIQFGSDAQGDFAYCVGDDGVVLFSDDGGVTWSLHAVVTYPSNHPIWPSVKPDLWDLHFFDRDTGFLVGYHNAILRTDDGLQSFRIIAPASHSPYQWYRIHAWSEDEFVAVANRGRIARLDPSSPDVQPMTLSPADWCYEPQLSCPEDGFTWGLELVLWDVRFVGDTGFAVGGVGTNDGYIFRSDNRGADWTLDTSRFDYLTVACTVTPATYWGVELFGDPDYGVVVGYASTSFYRSHEQNACGPTDCPPAPFGDLAWIQTIMDTDDNGVFDEEDDLARLPMNGITASPSNEVAYATGGFGIVRRTNDLGLTWTDVAGKGRGRISAGDFSDMHNGILAGQLWRVFETDDGGENFVLTFYMDPPDDPSKWKMVTDCESPTGKSLADPPENIPYHGQFNTVAMATTNSRAVVAGDRGRLVVRDPNGDWHERHVGGWSNGPEFTSALISPDGLLMLVGGAPFGGATLRFSTDGGATPFGSLTLLYGGNPVLSKIVDVAVDSQNIYYLTANKNVYVATLGNLAQAFAAVPVPAASAVTALGVRSVTEIFVGSAGGEIFQFDPQTISFQLVSAVDPDDLGKYCFSITPVPSSTTWYFTGVAGKVLRYDGTSWDSPKSAIQGNVVGAAFFSEQDGFLIGRVHNVSRLASTP